VLTSISLLGVKVLAEQGHMIIIHSHPYDEGSTVIKQKTLISTTRIRHCSKGGEMIMD
jgi:hypothetical protein